MTEFIILIVLNSFFLTLNIINSIYCYKNESYKKSIVSSFVAGMNFMAIIVLLVN